MSTTDQPRRRRALDRPTQPVVPQGVKVTPQERRRLFAAHYLLHHNATAAAIAAGLSAKTAKSCGARMLTHADVQALIAAGVQKDRQVVARAARKLDFTREAIMEAMGREGFSSVLDFGYIDERGQFVIDMSATATEEFAAIGEVKSVDRLVFSDEGVHVVDRVQSIKLRPRMPALVKLAEMQGYLRDDGAPPTTVNFNIFGLYPDNKAPKRKESDERPIRTIEGSAKFNDPARR